MDSGDAGHILISKRVADDLAQYRRWQPYLHELGDCEVKHGVIISLVNLYADAVGNPSRPAKLTAGNTVTSTAKKRRSLILGLVLLSCLLSLMVIIWQRSNGGDQASHNVEGIGPTVQPTEEARPHDTRDSTPTPAEEHGQIPTNSPSASEPVPSAIPLREFGGRWLSVNRSPIAGNGTLTVQDELAVNDSAINEMITTEWFVEGAIIYRMKMRVQFGELWAFQNQLNARCLATDIVDVFDPKGFGKYANLTEQTRNAAKAGVSLVYTWNDVDEGRWRSSTF
jgi:hypothetical protein